MYLETKEEHVEEKNIAFRKLSMWVKADKGICFHWALLPDLPNKLTEKKQHSAFLLLKTLKDMQLKLDSTDCIRILRARSSPSMN